MLEWNMHPSLTFNIFPIFPCEHQITRWGKMAIHPMFYNTIVQFAQVSNFSKVPLQSGLKIKHLSNLWGGERKPARVFSGCYIYRLLHHTFHTKHLLHQAPFTLPQAGRPRWIRASDPNAPYQNCLVVQTAARHSMYTRHLFTRRISHHAPFTPDNFHSRQLLHQPTFTPVVYFYTNQLLQQKPFTPPKFHTCLILLHQPAFTPDTFYTNQLFHETPFTPTSFYTRHLVHQKPFHETPFTLDTLYTRHLLHEATFYTTHPFTPDTFYTRRLLHQTPFTSTDFYTTPFIPNFHTCLILLHQPAFTSNTFYTNQLLHETPFTPTSFYTRQLLQSFTQDTLYTRHLWQEATFYTTNPFTPDTFYTRRLLHQTPFTFTDFYTTPFTPNTFCIKHLLHYPRQADQGGFEPLTPTHRTKIA